MENSTRPSPTHGRRRRRRYATSAIGLAVAATGLVLSPEQLPPGSALTRYMHTRATHTSFSGAVLVSRGGETLLHAAYGMAQYELEAPNTVATLFRIGSLTKPLTAVAALRLVERKRLDLEGRVCAAVAACPPEWRSITVRQLLSHRSGLPDLFSRHSAGPVEAAADGFDRILAELDSTRARGDRSAMLRFEPGSRYEYNNFNYVFLAYVMERATGRYWEEILREQVFVPAGMTSTRYDRVYDIVPGRARGYRIRDGRLENTDYDHHEAYAAGGLLSTTDDLRRFMQALVTGDLLAEETRAAMFRPGLGDHGLGWQIVDSFGRTVYNHTGSIGGFSSYLAFYPEDALLVIVLSNVQDESARGTGCDLAGLALGRPVTGLERHLAAPPARASQVDRRALGRYVGDGDDREIRLAGGGAVEYARGPSTYDLLLVAPDSFTVAASPETLFRLTRDGTGDVSGLRIERCGGLVSEARKAR